MRFSKAKTGNKMDLLTFVTCFWRVGCVALSVAREKLHFGERRGENWKDDQPPPQKKRIKKKAEWFMWLTQTVPRENVFPSCLTWKHAWGESEAERHDAMPLHTESLLKTWQLSENPATSLGRFICSSRHYSPIRKTKGKMALTEDIFI